MNIALCFCVRDCGKYLERIFSNIELLKTFPLELYCIFVYDNCKDNSETLLKAYAQKNPKNVILKNIKNNNKARTVRIAKARNTCLDIVYNQLENIDYFIMVDSDNRCCAKWNAQVIYDHLQNIYNDDWDCISFNQKHYYDIWALMLEDFKHHAWGFGRRSKKVVLKMEEYIKKQLTTCETNSISVISAFNGFCIYNANRFKGFHYDGLYKNIRPLICDEERDATIKFVKKHINIDVKCDDEFTECCEHLFFHLNAYKQGRKIKISKSIVIED